MCQRWAPATRYGARQPHLSLRRDVQDGFSCLGRGWYYVEMDFDTVSSGKGFQILIDSRLRRQVPYDFALSWGNLPHPCRPVNWSRSVSVLVTSWMVLSVRMCSLARRERSEPYGEKLFVAVGLHFSVPQ